MASAPGGLGQGTFSKRRPVRVCLTAPNALFEADLDPHLVHPGAMGVCCYSTIGAAIPEGYLPVSNATMDGNRVDQDKLCHQCRLSRRCHRWLFPRGQLDLA